MRQAREDIQILNVLTFTPSLPFSSHLLGLESFNLQVPHLPLHWASYSTVRAPLRPSVWLFTHGCVAVWLCGWAAAKKGRKKEIPYVWLIYDVPVTKGSWLPCCVISSYIHILSSETFFWLNLISGENNMPWEKTVVPISSDMPFI